jgi:P27 family predicted phage terminase small subunit
MGRRGPAPAPTHLKVLQGNPGHRPLPKNEPKPRDLMPACPAWLDPEAKAEWKRVAPLLKQLNLLTEVDGTALAGYCQAYATWRRATATLQQKGYVVNTPSGYKQQRPEVSIAMKALGLVKVFCAEFGMTPSSRSRIDLPGDESEIDPLDALRSRSSER